MQQDLSLIWHLQGSGNKGVLLQDFNECIYTPARGWQGKSHVESDREQPGQCKPGDEASDEKK